MMKKIILILAITLLTACSQNIEIPAEELMEEFVEVYFEHVEPVTREYRMEFEIYYTFGKYEPRKGVYLGAYIQSNRRINYDMREFDRLTERKHLIYTYNMKLGDDFPLTWLLESMLQGRMPLINISPADIYNPFDMAKLIETAEKFAQLQMPMFIQFFGDPAGHAYDIDEYIRFFRNAHRLFRESNPHIAFVFNVSNERVAESKLYYPGDDYVDWVSMTIILTIASNRGGEVYDRDIFRDIDIMYYTFQKTKPMMISGLAVSHFTTRTNSYYVMQASEKIGLIYNRILNEYPRIRAIVYMDFNDVELSTEGIRDNFSITDNGTFLNAYREAIRNEMFLSYLEQPELDAIGKVMVRSPFPVVRIGDVFFISKYSLLIDLEYTELSLLNDYIQLENGQIYYSLNSIKQRGNFDIEFGDIVRVFRRNSS